MIYQSHVRSKSGEEVQGCILRFIFQPPHFLLVHFKILLSYAEISCQGSMTSSKVLFKKRGKSFLLIKDKCYIDTNTRLIENQILQTYVRLSKLNSTRSLIWGKVTQIHLMAAKLGHNILVLLANFPLTLQGPWLCSLKLWALTSLEHVFQKNT